MTQPPVVAYVFAHQDDEYFVNAAIRRAARDGAEVHCIYLTSGVGWRPRPGVTAQTRNAESLAVLRSYGVADDRIHFAGERHGIGDMRLADRLADASDALCDALEPLRTRIAALHTLAWEGGHPDHDAAHVACVSAAVRFGLLGVCRQFPAYNGCGVGPPFFRVMHPLHATEDRRLGLAEAMRSALQCWRYPSQRRTWLGLFPQALARWTLGRAERLMRVSPRRLAHRPHEGQLLYERMFERRSYEDFAARVDAVVRAIADQAPASGDD